MSATLWAGRRVLITGHTGFKGSWLSLWLNRLGAIVSGYSLPPPTDPSLFRLANLAKDVQTTFADVRDLAELTAVTLRQEPEIVFHLAAQPLVLPSYDDPVETYATNVMGTVHLLEAVRKCPTVRVVVIVTSDKSYENREWPWGYREVEPMGGYDPYSSSKGCAELVAAAYRRSFFSAPGTGGVAVATARAGNVIGGGDWARHRLIPDFFAAALRGETLELRSPSAVRPWQHVLEPIAGYVRLAERLWSGGAEYAEGWNFGPFDSDARPVSWVVDTLSRLWEGQTEWRHSGSPAVHEAGTLKLDISKARQRLGWEPRWTLEEALVHIVAWYRAYQSQQDMRTISLAQIESFVGAGA